MWLYVIYDYRTSSRRLTQFRRPCWSRWSTSSRHLSSSCLIARYPKVTFMLSSKRRSSPLQWRNQDSMLPTPAHTDLFRTCRYCRSSWSASSSASWWNTWHPLISCHYSSLDFDRAIRLKPLFCAPSCRPWWLGHPDPSGLVCGLRHGRTLHPSAAPADELRYQRKRSPLVSVIPVWPQPVRSPRTY